MSVRTMFSGAGCSTFGGQARATSSPTWWPGSLCPCRPASHAETVGALIAACAELSTFSRNLSHLVSLLRQGAFRPAEEYRPMLTTLSIDVREHLDHLTRSLAGLQSRRGSAMQQGRSGATQPGARS
jgi:hypothetical protein